jgi:myo-inositol-1(or 4)-monophosphatase
LKEILTAARPDYGWLSEETAADLTQLTKNHVFVVDPIDGTRSFIDRGNNFGVSVGLLYKGQPVLGVVYRPVEHQLISGGQGLGVFLDGKPVGAKTYAGKPRLLVGYRENNRGRYEQFDADFDIQVEGSIAYRYAMVGAGLAEVAVSYHELSLWDVAAGHAIARAGGAEAFMMATGESYNYQGPSLTLPPATMCAAVENKDTWRQVFTV